MSGLALHPAPLADERAGHRAPVSGETASAGPDPDARVLAAARNGDRDARAALLTGFQDIWFRFCLAMLEHPEAARDATQETALRFLQRLNSFNGQSTLRTWSLGIALNVCREARRKGAVPVKGAQAGRPHLALVGAADASPAGPAALVEREEQAQVRRLVADLPRRQREAVLLRYFEGLSVADAARTMGCAVGTAKATLAQALASLRRHWETRP